MPLGSGRFHAFLYPLALLRRREVHEFCADTAAVNLPSFLGIWPIDPEIRRASNVQKTERVKVCFDEPPAAESVENLLSIERGQGLR